MGVRGWAYCRSSTHVTGKATDVIAATNTVVEVVLRTNVVPW